MACLNGFRITIFALLGAAAYFAFLDNGNDFIARIRRAPAKAVSNFCSKSGDLAMTFDGGVGSQTVPVLKALKDNGAVATFHVVTAYFKDVSVITNLQAAYSDGHLIGLRFPTTVKASSLTSQQLAQTLTSESEKIYNVLGVYPKYVRFDIDENENSNVLQVAQSLGFVVTSYNIDSMDYQSGANTQSIVAQYTNQFSSVMSGQGRFITVHQDLVPIYADQSILANVIKTASANGYKTVTLDVCVGDAAYRTKNDNSFSGKSSDATTTGISGILGLSALATLFNIFV